MCTEGHEKIEIEQKGRTGSCDSEERHFWKQLTIKDVKPMMMMMMQSTISHGATTDNKLTLNEHVNNVCKAAQYHVRALRHVRKYISENTAKTIASSLVGTRLDYCNAVLYGTARTNIDKLQRV